MAAMLVRLVPLLEGPGLVHHALPSPRHLDHVLMNYLSCGRSALPTYRALALPYLAGGFDDAE